MSTPIGAAIRAVATLLSTSERVMVTTIRIASTTLPATPASPSTMACAISAVPPLASRAAPMGSSEPSSTITGHSTDS